MHAYLSDIHIFNSGKAEVIETLLKYGVNVNIKRNDGRTPLHTAVQNGNNNYFQFDLRCISACPIWCTHVLGEEKIVKLLLKNGANVNIKKNDGKTPLHMAIAQQGSCGDNSSYNKSILIHFPWIQLKKKSSRFFCSTVRTIVLKIMAERHQLV